jgi:hypothetical protein
MATIHGKNAVVYLQGSGSDAIVLTEANEWQISIDSNTVEDNAFGDSWVTMLKGLLKASGSINGNYDTAQSGNSLWEAVVASTARKLYLYPDRATVTNYYYGTVYPKLSATMPIGKGTFSMSFDVNGQLALN